MQVAVSDGPTRPSGTAGSASGSVPSISPRMRVSNVEFAARRRPSASAYAIDETRRSSSLAAASALSAYPRGSFSMSASASMATAASATLPDLPMSSGALAGECRQRARVEGDVAAASEPLGRAPAGLPPSFHQREPQVRRLIVLDGRHRVVIRSHDHILPFPFHPAPTASLESRLPRIAPAHAR